MKETHLKVKDCTVAGITADGVTCYWGKKETNVPTSRDLVYWVTLGKPRVDGSNYVRLGAIGFDENKRYPERDAKASAIDWDAVETAGALAVSNHLLTVTSAQMRKQMK